MTKPANSKPVDPGPLPPDPEPHPVFQFVTCTVTTLNDVYDALKQRIDASGAVRVCLYIGRCKTGGQSRIRLSATKVKKTGFPGFPNGIMLWGTRIPFLPDVPPEAIRVRIGNDFLAWVDDGKPHPLGELVFVASSVQATA